MKIIDFQSHFMPRSALEVVNKVVTIPQTQRYLKLNELLDLERRIKLMDRLGIDVQIIGAQGWDDFLDSRIQLEASRASNDEVSRVISRYPDRFVGLATLPLHDIDESLNEIDRSVSELGLKGIWLPSNVNGKPLDSSYLHPIYEKCLTRGVPVVLHPTMPHTFGDEAINVMRQYGLVVTLGFLYESSFSVLRLILSGVMEKYSGLKLVLPHVGGVLPYLTGRIDTGWHHYESEIKKAPSEYLKQIYVDTVTGFGPALSCALSMPGIDRILFATDYPYWEIEDALSVVKTLNLNEEDEAKILHKNAESILKL